MIHYEDQMIHKYASLSQDIISFDGILFAYFFQKGLVLRKIITSKGANMTEFKADMTIDTRGLTCPMPVLKTKKAIDMVVSGQTLLIIATDPASRADIPALLGRLGHELVAVQEREGVISFFIRKRSR